MTVLMVVVAAVLLVITWEQVRYIRTLTRYSETLEAVNRVRRSEINALLGIDDREPCVVEEGMMDDNPCRVDPYFTSGPVTPMTRGEVGEEALRCSRGTVGCFEAHHD